jgi:hypothetical protein
VPGDTVEIESSRRLRISVGGKGLGTVNGRLGDVDGIGGSGFVDGR